MSDVQPVPGTEEPPPPTARSRLSALIGDRRRTVLLLGICSTASALTEALILTLIATIASAAAKGSGNVQANSSILHVHASAKTLFIIAFAASILRVGLQAPLAVLPARISADVQARLRRDLFRAFSRASWTVQSRDREGYLQEVMTSQVMQATGGALQATQLVIAMFSFVVLMASALALNALAAGIILVAAVFLFRMLRPLNAAGQRRAKALSRAQLEYAGGISEAGRLAEETQVFGVNEAQRGRVDRLIGNARDLFFRTQVIARLSPSLYQSAIYLILVGGLAALYSQGASHFASLGAVVLMIVRAGTYGQQVQGSYQGLRQSLPYIERIQDEIRRYRESDPGDGGRPLPAVETLSFENVSYAYKAERPVLAGISFQVAAGETIGVVGPSGAGKSTLIQILLQLRRPDEGRYLVNGVPTEEFARADWHGRVAYVPQQPRLIHASVAENIRYFRDLDEEEVHRAGRLARIHEEVLSWPDGYDTIVGPRVDAVSGGQQQRICLARALAARPGVLVLDEPTSALDPHSETLIQDSLTGLRHELTLFIIAHRISTLDICDRVMVIVDGRLVAFDRTEVLRRENSYFRSASALAAGDPNGRLPESTGDGGGHSPEPPATGPASPAGTASPATTSPAPSAPSAPIAAETSPPAGTGARSTEQGGLAVSELSASPGIGATATLPGARSPDFYIVGQPKTGTTALYEMLRQHPQIFMPDSKEPWFFAEELLERTPPRPGGTPRTLAEYEALFAAAGEEQITGEASALYLWSSTAAERIFQERPDARVIAVLREPVSLLRSLHLQFLETYVETESDLRSALALESARREGRELPRHTYWPRALMYSEHVRYVEQLERYSRLFGPEQMLILIYDDFRRDNQASVRHILRFLGVDDTVTVTATQANPTVQMRSQRLNEIVHALSVGRGPGSRGAKGAIKAVTPRRLRRGALAVTKRRVLHAPAKPLDQELEDELRSRFRGEVEALSAYLGRDLLALWGYDAVG